MLLNLDESLLLLIDVQEKLIPAIVDKDKLIDRCSWLLKLAARLKVPVIVSEQYPKGLGATIEPLRTLAGEAQTIEKVSFSCMQEPNFLKCLERHQRKQLILIGIEAHVCVLQTALELHQSGYAVFVVVDAVGSRNTLDFKYGLKRMKQAGIQLITAEMVFFEWVKKAGTPEFKALSQAFLQ